MSPNTKDHQRGFGAQASWYSSPNRVPNDGVQRSRTVGSTVRERPGNHSVCGSADVPRERGVFRFLFRNGR